MIRYYVEVPGLHYPLALELKSLEAAEALQRWYAQHGYEEVRVIVEEDEAAVA